MFSMKYYIENYRALHLIRISLDCVKCASVYWVAVSTSPYFEQWNIGILSAQDNALMKKR